MRLRNRFRWLALCGCVAALGLSAPASAQGRESAQSDERDALRARAADLTARGEDLLERGEQERARQAFEQAREIWAHLERAEHPARETDRREGGERHREIMNGLEHGIAALRELGMNKEAERLHRIAAEVRERGERDTRRPTEREIGRRQLEVMRLAMPALREGERRDAADILEHAIHARELAMEGRDGPEAMEVRRGGPNRAQIAEILLLASRLWKDFGNEDKAHITGELGQQFARQERERRARDARDEGVESQERCRRAEREQIEVRESNERAERLEHRLGEMMNALEQVHGAMREMREEIRLLKERQRERD